MYILRIHIVCILLLKQYKQWIWWTFNATHHKEMSLAEQMGDFEELWFSVSEDGRIGWSNSVVAGWFQFVLLEKKMKATGTNGTCCFLASVRICFFTLNYSVHFPDLHVCRVWKTSLEQQSLRLATDQGQIWSQFLFAWRFAGSVSAPVADIAGENGWRWWPCWGDTEAKTVVLEVTRHGNQQE